MQPWPPRLLAGAQAVWEDADWVHQMITVGLPNGVVDDTALWGAGHLTAPKTLRISHDRRAPHLGST